MVQASMPQQGVATQSMRGVKWWVSALVLDRRIAMSWIFLFGGAFLEVYFLSGGFGETETPFGTTETLRGAAICGYCGWSLYWGVPPVMEFSRRIRNRLFLGVQALGCAPSILVFFGLQFVVMIYYPLLGGGLLHFFRRWWHVGVQLQPVAAISAATPPLPFPIAPAPPLTSPLPGSARALPQPAAALPSPQAQARLPDIEQRLRALALLLERGAITKDEHDQQRLAILSSI
jgi:hypothetical protein